MNFGRLGPALTGLLLAGAVTLAGWSTYQTQVHTARVNAVELAWANAQHPERYKESWTRLGERIIQLPNDGGGWHTSLLVREDWQARQGDRELVAIFDADPTLRSLKIQTHYHLYTPRDPIYLSNLAALIPESEFPAVLIQRNTGQVVYKLSGPALLGELGYLPERVAEALESGPCPRPGPSPSPTPSPNPRPGPIPDTRPILVPPKPAPGPDGKTPVPSPDGGDTSPWWLALIAALLGGGGVLVNETVKKSRGL